MRKRNICLIADKLFWGLILIFPIVFYFLYLFIFKDQIDFDFTDWMESFVSTDSDIFRLFQDFLGGFSYAFGDTQVNFDMFGQYSPVIYYLSYCALVEIAHVFFDIAVFIPRIAHKWLSKATQQDE